MPSINAKFELIGLEKGQAEDIMGELFRRQFMLAYGKMLTAILSRIPVQSGFLSGSFSKLAKAFPTKFGAQGVNLAAADIPRTRKGEDADETWRVLLENIQRESLSQYDLAQKLIGLAQQTGTFFIGQNVDYQKKTKIRRQPFFSEETEKAIRKGLRFYQHGKGGKKYPKLPKAGVPFAIDPQKSIKYDTTKGTVAIEISNSIIYYRVNDFYKRIRSAPWGSLDFGQNILVNALSQALNNIPQISSLFGSIIIKVDGVNVSKKRSAVGIRAEKFN